MALALALALASKSLWPYDSMGLWPCLQALPSLALTKQELRASLKIALCKPFFKQVLLILLLVR